MGTQSRAFNMSISLVSQGKFGSSGKLFPAKCFKKDIRKSFSLKGSKSFMRKRATSLQNLVGSLNTDEKSKDKKEFYSDVNLSNCAPEGPGEDKVGEHINNPEAKYLNFVEESFELDMEEENKDINDDQESTEDTEEQITEEKEDHQYIEDYFTLEKTEDKLQQNTDENDDSTDDDESKSSKQDVTSYKSYGDIYESQDHEEENNKTGMKGYGLLLKYLMPFLCIK